MTNSIQFGSSNFIQANAGCGKTYALSGQYIALLLRGEDPSAILASTFTRKAAAEILERVFLRLIDALEDSSSLQKQLPEFNINQQLISKTLQTLIHNLHKIQISTLDSFQTTITKLFAEELKLPFGWRIISEAEYRLITLDAISRLCSAIEPDEMWFLVSNLRRGQNKRSVSSALLFSLSFALEGLDLASPGIWNWLKAQKPSDWPKQDFLDRLARIELPKTKAGTTDKRIISAVEKICELVNASDYEGLLENGFLYSVKQGKLSYYKVPLPEDLIECGLQIFDLSGAFCLSRLANANQVAGSLTKSFIHELEALENSLGALTFSRITKKLLALSDSLYSNEFYFRLDSKIKHLLLDEFQDTSLAQWLLLKPLITEKLSDCTEEQSCFCVGDSKQSIYGWRGANADIFDLIPKNWPDINLGQLDTSYRSAPHIIEFINSVFKSLTENPALEDFKTCANAWLSKFQQHKTAIKDQKSEVYFEKINDSLDSEKYLATIFARIAEWIRYNPDGSVGILVRKNEELGIVSEYAKNNNIRISSEGGNLLSSFSVINCLLSGLKYLHNPHDKISRFLFEKSGLSLDAGCEHDLNLIRLSLYTKGLSETLKDLSLKITDSCSSLELVAVDKLIQLAISFEATGSLRELDNFFRLVNSTSIQESNPSQIKLMTVHKSKGLEFDLSVIADLSFSLNPEDSHSILITENPDTLLPEKVSLPGSKGIRAYSAELGEMAKRALNKEFQESLNILYVALSRAKRDLFLFCPEASLDSKSLNAAKLCSSVLAPVTMEVSDSEFSSELSNLPAVKSNKLSGFKNIIFSQQKSRGLASLTATSGSQSAFDNQSSKELMELGNLVHFLFSRLDWIENLQPEELLRQQLSGLTEKQDLVEKSLNRFFSAIKSREFLSVFDKKLWPESYILTEKSFVFRKGNRIIEGRIDRLIVSKDKLTVIDFKLGKKPEDQILNNYLNQLEIYKEGALRLFPGRQVECYILFLSDGQKQVLN